MWHQTLDPIKCLVLSNLPYGWEVWVCHRCRRQLPKSPARHMWHKCESGISKSCPSWVCNGKTKISTAASMGTRQSWGGDSPWGPESAAQQGAEVGHCEEVEEAGLAKERLGGHIESQLLTMRHGCANNVRQAKLPCKKIKDWVTLFGQVCLAAYKEERKGCKYNMLCRQRRESQPKDCFHVCEVWKIGDMYWALQPHSHPWKAISHQTNLQFKWQQNVCLELSDQISNWDILGT